MLIRTHHIRPGGSVHEIDGIEYHFKPQDEAGKGPHVAEVSDDEHIARFLSLKDGFIEDRVAQRNADRKAGPQIRDRSKPDSHLISEEAGDPDPRNADTNEALRTQYRELTGNPAHHTWDIAKIRAKIEEFKTKQAEGTGAHQQPESTE